MIDLKPGQAVKTKVMGLGRGGVPIEIGTRGYVVGRTDEYVVPHSKALTALGRGEAFNYDILFPGHGIEVYTYPTDLRVRKSDLPMEEKYVKSERVRIFDELRDKSGEWFTVVRIEYYDEVISYYSEEFFREGGEEDRREYPGDTIVVRRRVKQ